MPLVTLTCSDGYYPPDTGERVGTYHQLTIGLAESLPELVVENADDLHLDAGTTMAAVQVDIKKFHRFSVNSVDIWVHVWFSEDWPLVVQQTDIREALIRILREWFLSTGAACSWALDIAFGPTRGCFTDAQGVIQQRW